MLWQWYVEHGNEIMLDLDHSKGAVPRRVGMFRYRLRAALRANKIAVRDVWFYPSLQVKHYHVVIRLESPMPQLARAVWALRLGSDVYRACATMMRIQHGIGAASLLISDRAFPDFYRAPDHVCTCEAKHSPEIMAACPVEFTLRGPFAAADFFSQPSGKEVKGLPLAFGRITPENF
jgi:hypothetical protein